ncbi:unnamed protein product [Brassicogethes aeneus]|uniref:Uncharacterized protein n=1 Tax=Brassicogethes aeneus TaxID=1431903 RepID=A0A9P0FD46_BRAAE|nr:unnamed protein product [Brassicogethes aeneus]
MDGHSITWQVLQEVQRVVNRFNQHDEYSRRSQCDRRRYTNERDDRFIQPNVLRDRRVTSVEGIDEWKNILFTKEAMFCLKSPDGRQRIYRRTGERFEHNHFSPMAEAPCVTGLVRLTKESIKHMSVQNKGHGGIVINALSLGNINQYEKCPLFLGIKHFIISFSRALSACSYDTTCVKIITLCFDECKVVSGDMIRSRLISISRHCTFLKRHPVYKVVNHLISNMTIIGTSLGQYEHVKTYSKLDTREVSTFVLTIMFFTSAMTHAELCNTHSFSHVLWTVDGADYLLVHILTTCVFHPYFLRSPRSQLNGLCGLGVGTDRGLKVPSEGLLPIGQRQINSHTPAKWFISHRCLNNFKIKNEEWLKKEIIFDVSQVVIHNQVHQVLRDQKSIFWIVLSVLKAAKSPENFAKKIDMPNEQALALRADAQLSKYQYEPYRDDFGYDILPPYYKVLEAKKECYPDEIVVTETSA